MHFDSVAREPALAFKSSRCSLRGKAHRDGVGGGGTRARVCPALGHRCRPLGPCYSEATPPTTPPKNACQAPPEHPAAATRSSWIT